jgi:hypothetical protein
LSRTLTIILTAAVATVILVAGSVYSAIRPLNYRSEASIVLVPMPTNPTDVPGLLDSYLRSGTGGTYVVLLTSRDTLKRAGDPPVTVSARALPDTRTIRVTATSTDKKLVQPALAALLSAAQKERAKLLDAWRISVLQQPTAPTVSSTPTSFVLFASLVLSLLGALAVWLFLTRALTRSRRESQASGEETVTTPEWVTPERPRYPVSR